MQQLADLRPADREDQIGSTKNRFLNFLMNPIVELALGMPSGHLDLQQAIQDRAIIVISLARGGASSMGFHPVPRISGRTRSNRPNTHGLEAHASALLSGLNQRGESPRQSWV